MCARPSLALSEPTLLPDSPRRQTRPPRPTPALPAGPLHPRTAPASITQSPQDKPSGTRLRRLVCLRTEGMRWVELWGRGPHTKVEGLGANVSNTHRDGAGGRLAPRDVVGGHSAPLVRACVRMQGVGQLADQGSGRRRLGAGTREQPQGLDFQAGCSHTYFRVYGALPWRQTRLKAADECNIDLPRLGPNRRIPGSSSKKACRPLISTSPSCSKRYFVSPYQAVRASSPRHRWKREKVGPESGRPTDRATTADRAHNKAS